MIYGMLMQVYEQLVSYDLSWIHQSSAILNLTLKKGVSSDNSSIVSKSLTDFGLDFLGWATVMLTETFRVIFDAFYSAQIEQGLSDKVFSSKEWIFLVSTVIELLVLQKSWFRMLSSISKALFWLKELCLPHS